MNFDYDDDQRYLRDEARRFLTAACSLSAARCALGGGGFDRALWHKVAAQGWLGTAIPEAYGGLGLGHVELAAIAEEVGAAFAPLPFAPSLYLFTEAVLLAGNEEQKRALLPGIADGSVIGCAGLWEGAGDLDPAGIRARVVGGRLTGRKQPVVGGGVATHAVILAIEDGAPGLFVVALTDAMRTPLEAIDGSLDVARLDFDGASAERLGDGPPPIERLLNHAAALTAFEQIGGADRCLTTTISYVQERQAFGRATGSFQAVKHKLADLYVANQIARSHAYHAIWAIDAGDPRLATEAVAAARVAASDAYWLASKEAIHLHGAIGFTWEHDAHLFYRRAHHLSLWLGSPGWWKDRLYGAIAARGPTLHNEPAMADAVAGGGAAISAR